VVIFRFSRTIYANDTSAPSMFPDLCGLAAEPWTAQAISPLCCKAVFGYAARLAMF